MRKKNLITLLHDTASKVHSSKRNLNFLYSWVHGVTHKNGIKESLERYLRDSSYTANKKYT